MGYYVIKNKYTIPRFVYLAAASWVAAIGAVTLILLGIQGMSALLHVDVFAMIPRPVLTVLDVLGAYAGLGAIALYVTMWVYWIAVERSSIFVRIGWLLALLFLLVYGALIYACVVWRRDLVKYEGLQPLPGGTS